MRIAIVGAGLAGSVAAVLLREQGHKVEVFETREHIGGNCFDKYMNGVLVHQYGPHGFHTNNTKVWNFVNRFSAFNDVSFRVWGNTRLGMIPIPFNKRSAELVGALSPNQIRELVFVDYSEKHWGIPWAEIPSSITSRVPIARDSYDDRYHLDQWQGIPVDGYTALFEAMLDGVTVHLRCHSKDWKRYAWDHVVYTGSIDAFYDYSFGRLEYRSLRFDYVLEPPRAQDQINECNAINLWTRSIDHSHWLRQDVSATIISYEYPCEYDGSNTPFYPKPYGPSVERFRQYWSLAARDRHVTFLGRLATYKYLDMDDTIAQVIQKLNRRALL